MKARLLIEGFNSAGLWGWKDPRNSLTLPFWEDLLPGMKTLIMVRNPLEVAHSMKERNGTSYSFGLRLWEIYNRRVIETASNQERLVTHYDLFFQDPESELRRIAHFIGLPDAAVENAATLVKKRRRHTHFTVEHLIDARVAPEVIDVYRALIAEASPTGSSRGTTATAPQATKSNEADLLPGSVSRLNAFVPERIGADRRISIASSLRKRKPGTRSKSRNSVSIWNKQKLDTRHKSPSSALTWRKPKLDTSHKSRNSPLTWRKPKLDTSRKSRNSAPISNETNRASPRQKR